MDVEVLLIAAVGLAGIVLGWTTGLVERRRLRRSATTDALTDLPNRRGWEQHAGAALRQLGPGRAAVALVDLDRLKALNQRFGHAGGDRAIAAIAQRLRTCPRVVFAARLGGDEFAAIVDSDQSSYEAVAATVHQQLGGPCQSMPVTASLGIAVARGSSLRELLAYADAALYAAKEQRTGFVVTHDLALSYCRPSESAAKVPPAGPTCAIGASR